jgi:N-acetylglucosamine kinase-like BadF-type ATPase
MTKEEVQQKTNEKVKAIQTLCNQLQVSLTAEQIIAEGGIIKNAIYYTDMQKYEMDEMPLPEIKKFKRNKNDNTTPHK